MSQGSNRRTLAALVAILAVAALLRFWSLSWGLRQVPLRDEALFVANVVQMVQEKDWDQRFYEYPGLFLYLLRPVFSLLPVDSLPGALPYLVARGVVAAFGVVSVGLVFLLGSSLVSPRAGLVAALLSAVSPIEVITAHMVRPDVVLEAFSLLALLSFATTSTSALEEIRSGIALGAAAGVKFTGILLAPSYLFSRLRRPGLGPRGIGLAALSALGFWVLTTPYAFLSPRAYWQGVRDQWDYHYRTAELAPRFLELCGYYLETLWNSLGPVGLAFTALGVVAAARRWRQWAFILAFPTVMIVVLSTAEARWSRLLLPTLGATALVAGLGFETLAANRPRLVTALALAGALWPLADSVAYVRDISQPDTRDRALDWLAAHQRRGARVLTNMPDLGLAGAGYEALQTTGVAHDDALLARNVDVVALDPGAGEIGGLELLAAFDRTDARREAPRIEIRSAGADLRPRYRETAIAVVRVGLQSPVDVPALADHDLDTEWASEVDQDQRVEVGLSDAACIGRVELLLGTHPQRFARALALSVTTDGVSWVHVHAPASRGPVTAQIARGDASPSQVLVFDPIRARAVRLDGASRRSRRWGFAEIRVDAVGDSDMVCPRGATSP